MELLKDKLAGVEKIRYYLRFLIPIVSIFFGFFIWFYGGVFDIYPIASGLNIIEFNYIGAWIFTLLYVFYNIKAIQIQSKILVILLSLFVSVELYGVFQYTGFAITCALWMRSPIFETILMWTAFFSIPGAVLLAVISFMPRFHKDMNYLTNLERIRKGETNRLHKIPEIFTTFPVFFGIYHIFFLIKSMNPTYCYTVPVSYALIIALPWIFLMICNLLYDLDVILLNGRIFNYIKGKKTKIRN